MDETGLWRMCCAMLDFTCWGDGTKHGDGFSGWKVDKAFEDPKSMSAALKWFKDEVREQVKGACVNAQSNTAVNYHPGGSEYIFIAKESTL